MQRDVAVGVGQQTPVVRDANATDHQRAFAAEFIRQNVTDTHGAPLIVQLSQIERRQRQILRPRYFNVVRPAGDQLRMITAMPSAEASSVTFAPSSSARCRHCLSSGSGNSCGVSACHRSRRSTV